MPSERLTKEKRELQQNLKKRETKDSALATDFAPDLVVSTGGDCDQGQSGEASVVLEPKYASSPRGQPDMTPK